MAEEKKKSLALIFAKAAAKGAAKVALLAALLYGAWYGACYAGRGEKLTKGETQLVQSVFGDDINASAIRKHFKPPEDLTHIAPKAVGTVLPPFSHIDFFGTRVKSKDYSKDNEYRYGVFMHEVTHCWQGQHFAFPLKRFEIYKYELTAKSHWRDFGAEQQADMVENYSKRWLYPKNVHIKHTAQDSLLAHVVEERFPHAKQTRLQLEAAPKNA